jgi:putative hydrolase of the HAD superfamily
VTIRAVIFDLGHTVWDYVPTQNGRRLSVLGLHQRLATVLDAEPPDPPELDAALAQTMQGWLESWRSSDDLTQPPSETLVGEGLKRLGFELDEAQLRELTLPLFGSELDPPVVEPDSLVALAELHERGLVMGCVTNTILLERGIRDALYSLGLLRYFDSVVVSSAMGYRKPHASLFRRALEELGVAAGAAVFVGDRLVEDVSGAQAVGMRAVLTHQYRQEFVEGGATRPEAVIARLAELPSVIERLEIQD